MLEHKDLDKILENNNKKFLELAIRNETLNRQAREFLEEMEITPEQLTTFIENKENFSEKNWKDLQEKKSELEEKLQTEIKSIKDPLKTKKAYAERKIAQHWLFVR